jgi:hypothetical protein
MSSRFEVCLLNPGVTDTTRPLAAWTATHDNGWTTGATENPDGTFAAWTTPPDHRGPIPAEYIEDSPENGMRAAE